MSGTWGFINIGKKAQNIDIAEPIEPYSGVRLIVGVDENGDQLVYIGGSEDGRVLEVENPFGTQAMANAIYDSVRGYQYQPLYADVALLNPAAEIGDSVSANGVYSGIYTRATTFGTLMASDISAPTNEEVIHEFNIPTPEERKFQRLNYDIQSQFKLTNNEIEAKVSKTSPQGQSSFGWNLQNNQWTVFNESGNILKATASGLEVTGKIQADEGYIGGENGFVIKASAIYSGISSFGGEGNSGVYVGTDGIQLGQGFKADSSGAVTATSLKIVGGMIELGEPPEDTTPIEVRGYIYYRWTTPVDTEKYPYFVIPNGINFAGILNNGTELPDTYYNPNGSVISLTQDCVRGLGVGDHSGIQIKTFIPPEQDPIDPIVVDANPGIVRLTYNDWQYYQLSSSQLPYIVASGSAFSNSAWKPVVDTRIRFTRWEIDPETGDPTRAGSRSTLDYKTRLEYVDSERVLRVDFLQSALSKLATNEKVGEDWISWYTVSVDFRFLDYSGAQAEYFTWDSPDFHVIAIDVTYDYEQAPTLVIETAKGIQGYFRVDNSGAVTASNMTIIDGSININDKFVVTANGDLTAESGTFRGKVYAGGIVSSASGDPDAGYFDGSGLAAGSVLGGFDGAIGEGAIGGFNVDELISSSLANGDYAASQLYNGFSSGININGNLVYQHSVVQWMPVRLASGGTAYAMCTYSRQ